MSARNLITDVPGLRVGHASDGPTGCTVLTGDAPFTCGVHVMGGAPGTRETDLLAPDKTVQQVDALVLSGGSAFGLESAGGVMRALAATGRGFAVGEVRIPIVPAAILFDLGEASGPPTADFAALGRQALTEAVRDFPLGSVGAGTGATTATLKGGIGSASESLQNGVTIGALVAVNALGDATDRQGRFWAAPFALDDEIGAAPLPGRAPPGLPPNKTSALNTTIAIIATDAALTQAQCTRIATAAHDGMARALLPSHTPLDGDLVFAAATGARPIQDAAMLALCHAASTTLARAIARGVFAATEIPGISKSSWASRFGPAPSDDGPTR